MTAVSLYRRPSRVHSASATVGPVSRARRVFDDRRILRLLVARDLKVRHAGSALGYLWSVLEPLLMSLVHRFVFTEILHRKVGHPPYLPFLLSGQLPDV